FSVCFDAVWNMHGAERQAPIRGSWRGLGERLLLRGCMALIRGLPALAGRLRKGSACRREGSDESSHENRSLHSWPPIKPVDSRAETGPIIQTFSNRSASAEASSAFGDDDIAAE